MNEEINPETSIQAISQTESLTPDEKEFEKSVRPDNFVDFVGQFKVVENLKIFVEAATATTTNGCRANDTTNQIHLTTPD